MSANSLRWVDSTLAVIRYRNDLQPADKSIMAHRACQVAEFYGDPCRQALACIWQAPSLGNMGMPDSALYQLLTANRLLVDSRCDSMLLMRLYANLGNIYITLGEYPRVDSVSRLALAHWNPAWTDVPVRLAILNNQSLSFAYREDMAEAKRIMHRLYSESRMAGDSFFIQQSLSNLGSLSGQMEDFDSAYYYLGRAAELGVTGRNYDDYLTILINLSNLDRESGRYADATKKLDKAYLLADSMSRMEYLADIQEARAVLYAAMNDYKRGYAYLDTFILIREQLLDEKRIEAVAQMMEQFESERKARRIQQLELDKLDSTVRQQRANYTRNVSLIGVLVVLGLAAGLWSRLRYMRRSRAALQQQMAVADGLLLNILPANVASELKSSGTARARQYPQATILFSDFQDFTFISSHMDPERLVSEVNTYFKAFDAITRHYGLEKIKTIGDAYMAAAGLEEISRATAVDAVRAALAMQAYVAHRTENMRRQGLPVFEMRLGLHSGPVIAGVVGDSKFQYDLWGDTVNTASRMEGLGETGHVNISENTYQLVRHDPAFSFQSRGNLEVKGKGQMPLYFVFLAAADGDMERLVLELAAGKSGKGV
jgi:class 3 adenylate cyclase